jgi:DNA-directed RNA polymerase subunit RPC12/RpoP
MLSIREGTYSESCTREGMMQLDFQCQKCEESFSLDVADVQSDPTLRCPGCGTRAPEEQVETVVGALEEVFAALAPLRRKFSTSVEVNSEDMPPPYDERPVVASKPVLLDEEDSEDEEEEDEEDEEVAELE